MLKMARWSFLANEDKMNFKEKVALQDILAEHENQAICYSMKEEMIALYEFRSYTRLLRDGSAFTRQRNSGPSSS